jgi:dihydrofolate synthase/folylpolyglutamate synthase
LLELLADPQDGYPIIHVAGTNGKTSTVRMAANLISGHGLTPGILTSPHLHRVEERFEHGLQPMTPDQFALAMAELAPIVDLCVERSGDGITYFELTAALAFAWFAEKAVDAAVIETGLGGRLDATNAARSEVAVVTTIGLEHTAYLGGTITKIAAEKLAILDEGALLVTGDLHPDAQRVAEKVAAERGAVWFSAGRDFDVSDVRLLDGGWAFDIHSVYEEYSDVELRLRGRHQIRNFAAAVAAVEALLGRALDEAGVREAAATVTAPGRMEILRRDPLLMVDGAHNPEAMAVLAAALREEMPGIGWEIVFGTMIDKDTSAMLEPFSELVTSLHAVAVDSPRARPAAETASVVESVLDIPVNAYDSTSSALDAAIASGNPVLVTGSIYLVGEAREALSGR